MATARCARIVTDEYVKQREYAEKLIANKETDKSLISMIKREYRDEKAVKIAIGRIHKGEYAIVHKDPAEQEREEQAILGVLRKNDEPAYNPLEDRELAEEAIGGTAEESAEDEE